MSYLISAALKSSLLLAAGLMVLRLLRSRDAAVRHLVCILSLASAAIAPFLALWSPRWSILISIPASAGGASSAPVASVDWP
jgi:hypothetical protein